MTHNEAIELKKIRELLIDHDIEYLKYRGSCFDTDGTLLWAKDDAEAYHEGIMYAIKIIEDRLPKEIL